MLYEPSLQDLIFLFVLLVAAIVIDILDKKKQD